MSSINNLSSQYPSAFGQAKIASGFANLAATGNAVANLAILGGGITQTGGAWTARRVIAVNLGNGNVAPANVSLCGSQDGNQANTITGNVLLSSLSANNTFQEVTMPAAANTTVFSFQSLSVIVNTANSSATNILFNVYGDIINP